jgi:HlyD family secretion protein
MSARRIIIAVVIIVILAVVALFVFQTINQDQETGDSTVDEDIPPVIGGSGLVTAEGEVVPLRNADLSFPVDGAVAEILVEEGDIVESGAPLIRLDTDELEIALSQAQAGLAAAEAQLEAAQAQLRSAGAGADTAELGVLAAEAQLALLTSDPLPEEIAAAEQNIAAAEAGVSQASGNQSAALQINDSQIRSGEAGVSAAMADVNRLEEAYDTILTTCFELPTGDEICPLYGTTEEAVRAELEVARLKLDSAQAALDSLNAGATNAQRLAAAGGVTVAQANRDLAAGELELLLAGPTAEQVRQAEVEVEQAKAATEQAQVGVEVAEADVAQAEAGVLNAQGNVDAAQAALDRLTLEAVFPGTVGSVDVELGQSVLSGSPVLTLADLSSWQVETTDLSELDVASVIVGDSVDVELDAIPGEILNGTIEDIARVSQFIGGDVTYVVVVRLDDYPDLPLRWGMTANVTLEES